MRIIAGQWRGRRLNPIRGKGIRPTSDRVREAWFAALGGGVNDARVLDLFAGSGALGLEALSRGAREAVFVELSRGALAVLERNIELLGAERACRIIRGDAMAFAGRLEPLAFDLALADPPYDRGFAPRILELFAAKGFARELWVEHRSSEVIPTVVTPRQRRYGDTTLSILTRPE